jgi:hypothetical protein
MSSTPAISLTNEPATINSIGIKANPKKQYRVIFYFSSSLYTYSRVPFERIVKSKSIDVWLTSDLSKLKVIWLDTP